METPDALIIQHTEAWIRQVVVGCNFCPFAAKALLQKSVRYRVVRRSEAPNIIGLLAEELKYLDEQPETETTFIILPDDFSDFEDYLDLTEAADGLIANEDYEGVYQVASFHPLYRFSGALADDPANYTNRSPYPMLHLLREASIEKALAHYKDPEGIPERNIDFARKRNYVAVLLRVMKIFYQTCKLTAVGPMPSHCATELLRPFQGTSTTFQLGEKLGGSARCVEHRRSTPPCIKPEVVKPPP